MFHYEDILIENRTGTGVRLFNDAIIIIIRTRSTKRQTEERTLGSRRVELRRQGIC